MVPLRAPVRPPILAHVNHAAHVLALYRAHEVAEEKRAVKSLRTAKANQVGGHRAAQIAADVLAAMRTDQATAFLLENNGVDC